MRQIQGATFEPKKLEPNNRLAIENNALAQYLIGNSTGATALSAGREIHQKKHEKNNAKKY